MGASSDVADAQSLDRAAEDLRDVAGSVVSHHVFNGDPQALEPAHGTLEKAGHRHALLVWQNLLVDDARVVVDADMQKLPALAPLTGAALPMNPVAHPVDHAELLRVQVKQLTRSLSLVADDDRLGVEAA